jgi:hypothetical protein
MKLWPSRERSRSITKTTRITQKITLITLFAGAGSGITAVMSHQMRPKIRARITRWIRKLSRLELDAATKARGRIECMVLSLTLGRQRRYRGEYCEDLARARLANKYVREHPWIFNDCVAWLLRPANPTSAAIHPCVSLVILVRESQWFTHGAGIGVNPYDGRRSWIVFASPIFRRIATALKRVVFAWRDRSQPQKKLPCGFFSKYSLALPFMGTGEEAKLPGRGDGGLRARD